MTRPARASTTNAPADYAHALAWLGGDRDLLMELTAMFLADYSRRMQALEGAVVAGDAAAIEHAAHLIKGSVAGLGAKRAQGLAEQLEVLGKEKRLPESTTIYGTLTDEIDHLVRYLRSPEWGTESL